MVYGYERLAQQTVNLYQAATRLQQDAENRLRQHPKDRDLAERVCRLETFRRLTKQAYTALTA